MKEQEWLIIYVVGILHVGSHAIGWLPEIEDPANSMEILIVRSTTKSHSQKISKQTNKKQ